MNFIKTIFILLITFSIGYSQEVMEVEKVMSKGTQSAVSVQIEDVNQRSVESWWRDFARNYTKSVKKDRKSKEWLSDDAEVNMISEATPVDLYTTIESAGKYVVVTTWVESGVGFINSAEHADAFSGLENLMQDFVELVDVEKVTIELSDQEKVLKKLESELKRLQSQNDGYHRDIEVAEKKIETAEENIKKNEKEQEEKQAEIEKQMELLEEVKTKKQEKEAIQKEN